MKRDKMIKMANMWKPINTICNYKNGCSCSKVICSKRNTANYFFPPLLLDNAANFTVVSLDLVVHSDRHRSDGDDGLPRPGTPEALLVDNDMINAMLVWTKHSGYLPASVSKETKQISSCTIWELSEMPSWKRRTRMIYLCEFSGLLRNNISNGSVYFDWKWLNLSQIQLPSAYYPKSVPMCQIDPEAEKWRFKSAIQLLDRTDGHKHGTMWWMSKSCRRRANLVRYWAPDEEKNSWRSEM